MLANLTFFLITFRWAIDRVNLMGDNRITGDISTDPLAAKSRTVSADEVKLINFIFYLQLSHSHGNEW